MLTSSHDHYFLIFGHHYYFQQLISIKRRCYLTSPSTLSSRLFLFIHLHVITTCSHSSSSSFYHTSASHAFFTVDSDTIHPPPPLDTSSLATHWYKHLNTSWCSSQQCKTNGFLLFRTMTPTFIPSEFCEFVRFDGGTGTRAPLGAKSVLYGSWPPPTPTDSMWSYDSVWLQFFILITEQKQDDCLLLLWFVWSYFRIYFEQGSAKLLKTYNATKLFLSGKHMQGSCGFLNYLASY
jgi:hypothetical protein